MVTHPASSLAHDRESSPAETYVVTTMLRRQQNPWFMRSSAFSSRLDYCNSLLFGVTDQQLKRLQSVQNAAARLVTGTRRSDHNHFGAEGPPLAASPAAHTVQDGDAGAQVLK